MHFMQVVVRALADEQKSGLNKLTVTAVEDHPVQSWVKAGQPFGQKVSHVQDRYYKTTQTKCAEELKR